MRSIHSTERIEEITCEVEGYKMGCNTVEQDWHVSSKATDGMHAKRGGQTSQKFGRHTKNPYSWEQGNRTTNTVLELC